jgi:hypothetical protein
MAAAFNLEMTVNLKTQAGLVACVLVVLSGACSGRGGDDNSSSSSSSSSSSGGASSSGGVPAGWVCGPLTFGDGAACDCGCGVVDPDCGVLGCAEANCTRAACNLCHDAQGREVSCGTASSSSSHSGSSSGGGASSTLASSSASSSTGTSSSMAGASSSADPCAGHVTYGGPIPSVTVPWVSNGLVGLQAGDDMCHSLGADHVCDYEEMLVASAAGEFSAVAAGVTVWVQRTTPAMVNGQTSQPGPGGNCNQWLFNGNHLADGEYAVFDVAGSITFHLDNDTYYDAVDTSHTIPGDLQCGSTFRSVFCCYPACP